MKRSQKVDVLNSPIPPTLLKLAWPMMITQVIQTLYNVVDAFWLGKLGKVKFSAPTVSFPIVFTFMALAFGLSNSGIALVSQAVGAGRRREAERYAMQIVVISLLTSSILMVVGYIFSGGILSLLGIGDPIKPEAEKYLKVIFLGMPFSFLMFTTSAVIRGWGNTVFTMKISSISIFLNIVLDPFMIFGIGFPRMEVAGAAWATVLSRGVATYFSLKILMSGEIGFKLHLVDAKLDPKIVAKIFKIGIPGAIGQAITASGFAVIMGMISRFGPAVVSSFGVGNRITSMLSTIGMSMSGAVSTMVGQFLGANDEVGVDRTVRWGFLETFSIVGTMAVFLFLFGAEVTKFFVNDPEVIELGETYFKLVSPSVPLFTMVSIVMGAFQGAGKTIYTAFINVVRLWGIRVPLVKILSEFYGYKGVFFAMTISNGLALLLGYTMLKLLKWKERVI